MGDILEFILNILLFPFEETDEEVTDKIKKIPHKGVRILLRILWIGIPAVIVFGVLFLCIHLYG